MVDIATIIQTTEEGPTFALRADAYRPGEAGELIADVVSLANATASGKRYVVFGVEAMPGGQGHPPCGTRCGISRRLVGISYTV